MKPIFILTILIAIGFQAYAQVPNKNETELPSEGAISEGSWGNYLLSNNTTTRALRIGVSNDGYTRGEIEIDNNNSIGSNIIFKTTNINGGALSRMIIKDNGNVGIGMSNPTHKLEIQGSLALKNGNTDLLLYRDNDVGDWSLLRTNTGNGIGLIGQPDVVALSVSRTTSNVGIGTTNPTAKLHVEGNGIRAQRFSVSNINDRINDSPWYGTGRSNFTDLSNDDQVSSVQLAGYYGILLKTSSGSIGIHQNGNVGIGTSKPDSKLTVKGKIHAEEVKIDLSVPAPDYVFKKDYDLLTIAQVQQHIKEKGHLPNIPSAKVLETEGVDLGLMNMKLLEKIEELTLYTIDQEKRLQQQTTVNKKLQSKNNELEARLVTIEKLLIKE
ncbi:hypothetical protein D1816_01400 [Aquimarina sp. AD10]|uniref:tail fiber protein n=1 Tax=Aquimarina sp. AD10 TaxID=1714849 RepID=UPI000E4A9532|nr:tail fiber protein [Aquimarina sp. AD10]AXT59060.1 hypothetical protein D1816_01400 [Aquimarina sp. AD10]RKM93393.1 hypothetical protein D7033_19855 [Aquimarina sp. AD10]